MKRAVPLIMMLTVLAALVIVFVSVMRHTPGLDPGLPTATPLATASSDGARRAEDGAPARTAYKLDVSYDPGSHSARVTQRVYYVNNTGAALDELYFHVYANAYNDPADPPFLSGEMSEAYPRGYQPGGLDFEYTRAASGADGALERGGTLIRYPLDPPLENGDGAVFDMAYTITLPYCYGRFGYGQSTASLANCFPLAAVYEDGAFRLDPYDKVGDPFYTECADWEVALSLPKGYAAAATGAPDGGVLKADNARDFCIIVSDAFTTHTRTVEGVEVVVYSLQDAFGARALDAAAAAVKAFNARFGRYPYGRLSVALADFFIGGMEYPGLVAIDATLGARGAEEVCEFVVVHEVAHQWWYGTVGSDQLRAPFQDEALTEFSTYLYLEDTKSAYTYVKLLDWLFYPVLEEMDARGEAPPIGAPLDAFEDSFTYSGVVYERGARLFMQLRERVGDERFFAMLRRYYADNAFGIARPGDLLDAIRQACSEADAQWFEARLYE